MILVQNRLLRLNGNKIGLFVILIVFLISCNGSKVLNVPHTDSSKEPIEELESITGKSKVSKGNEQQNSKDEDYTVKSSDDNIIDKYNKDSIINVIDSLGLIDIDVNVDSTISGDIVVDTKEKEIYKVCLSLPFYSNKSIGSKSNWALNYYTGVEMGMTYLEGISGDKNVDIKVFDSKVDDLDYELTNSIADYDLIIGPASKFNVNKVARIAKDRKVPFVSIYQTSQAAIIENPYYIQLRSSLKGHCEKLISEAMKKYTGANIILVSPNDTKNIKSFSYIQDYYKLNNPDSTAKKLTQIIIDLDEETNIIEETVFDEVLNDSTLRKVFIVMAWKRENFIIETLKLINAKKQFTEVSVLGLPQWMKFVDKSIDLFSSLNVKISSNYYLDPNSIEVRNFKKNYYSLYGSMPTKEAFEGYAMIVYFVRGLSSHGRGMINHLPSLRNAPFVSYNFERVPLKIMNENLTRYRLIENKDIKMLSFEGAIISAE